MWLTLLGGLLIALGLYVLVANFIETFNLPKDENLLDWAQGTFSFGAGLLLGLIPLAFGAACILVAAGGV
jgi:uncharacterized membrane protein